MQRSETESEARARRSVHVIGAAIVLFTVAAIIFGVSGGSQWAQKRQMRGIQAGVKADLLLVAEAESRFHKLHGFYTTDLRALNLWPKRVLFAFGFVKAGTFRESGETKAPLPDGVAPGSDAVEQDDRQERQ